MVRWNGDPADVIAQINALGYGLTCGIQTRIDCRALALAHAVHVGNIYINRNMIGAVVGVQPFGGEGLSGTGPRPAARITCTASAPSKPSPSIPGRRGGMRRC